MNCEIERRPWLRNEQLYQLRPPKQAASIAALLVGAIAAHCLGCGGSNSDRLPVTGSVSIDGQPVSQGSISFERLDGTPGPSAGAPIADGRFRIESERGLLPGNHVVSIRALRNTGRTVKDAQRGPIPEIVAVTFRERQLEAAVTADGENDFHFALSSPGGL